MHVESVNISAGRTVRFDGEDVPTGIFKEAVEGPVKIHRLGLEGDRVADLTVHGGEWKAVYAYATEHYAWWAAQLFRDDLAPGAFGENLTLAGLDEEDVAVGDVFTIGTATLAAAQPRQPCFKLGLKFGDMGMVRRFVESGRWGIYLRVEREGVVTRGDAVTCVSRARPRVPVAQLLRLQYDPAPSPSAIRQALEAPGLSPRWRETLTARLAGLSID